MTEPQAKQISKRLRYSTLNPSREIGSAFRKAAAHMEVSVTANTDKALVQWMKRNKSKFPHLEIPEIKG